MAPSPEEILRTASPFNALPEEDRRRLAEVAEVKSFAAGERIFSEADPSEYLYTIVSGRAKVYKMTPSGKDIILGIFGSGDPLGSVAVFKERPYPASAVAIEELVCIRTSRDALYTLLNEHPSVARGLLLGLTQRLIQLVNRVGELTGTRVEPRLARLFLRLMLEIGSERPDGVFIPLVLTRQELADMTGTTIETCIRVMSKWEKEATLHTDPEGFLVLDRHTLETLANT